MNKYKLDAQDTILMVIDVQDKLMAAMKDQEKVYARINLLLEAAKQLDMPVIVTEQYPQGLGSTVDIVARHLPPHQYLDKIGRASCRERV